ncbi:unnamed protein product [Schistosoma mattheei]|uniref:Uncharacterized protein n=1 Tax=Schistosoma mattheei TaxID=31246 RepID=A0A183PEC7_9TREM|nr:unnamed protein product [Schistosoma mattheei]
MYDQIPNEMRINNQHHLKQQIAISDQFLDKLQHFSLYKQSSCIIHYVYYLMTM